MPVTPTTLERLRALAAEWEAKGLEAAERLDEAATQAAFRRMVFYATQADQLQAEIEATRLSQVHQSSTLEPMEAAQVRSRGAAVSAALTDPDNKTMFQAALEKAKMSLPEWVATQDGLSHNTAQAWNKKPGAGGRPVPRLWADRIAKQFDRPALRLAKNWRNGIRE